MANFKIRWSILCDAHPDPTYVAWCSAGSCRVCDKGCLSKKGSGECLGFRFGVRVEEDLHCCVQPVAWDVMLGFGAVCRDGTSAFSFDSRHARQISRHPGMEVDSAGKTGWTARCDMSHCICAWRELTGCNHENLCASTPMLQASSSW